MTSFAIFLFYSFGVEDVLPLPHLPHVSSPMALRVCHLGDAPQLMGVTVRATANLDARMVD